MKVGLRTPSLKKSIKAKTTGKYKRKLKRLTNPFYGKKGMGWIKDPSRALKNKIYHKTTISAKSAIKGTSSLLTALLYYCIALPMKWLFWFMWIIIKWTIIFFLAGMRYLILGMAWLFVALYNGIISIVEKIINSKSEEPIANAEVTLVDSKLNEKSNE